MQRFSVYDVVNQYVVTIVLYGMRANPYAQPVPIEQGTMTIADIIELVRRHHGDAAAESVHFTMH